MSYFRDYFWVVHHILKKVQGESELLFPNNNYKNFDSTVLVGYLGLFDKQF